MCQRRIRLRCGLPNAASVCRGVAALLDGQPVAVFLIGEKLYAVDHCDPVSQTLTMARGLVGSVAGTPIVIAPMFKGRYQLATGRSLDGGADLQMYPVRVCGGRVEASANVTSGKLR